MEPHLRGLIILYAATTAWAILFAGWGFLAALVLQVPGIVVTVFSGPRLFGVKAAQVAFVVRAIPLPQSSVATGPPEPDASFGDDEEGAEGGIPDDEGHDFEDDGSFEPIPDLPPPPPPPPLPPPFGTLPTAARAAVLLGPFALLALLVALFERPQAITHLLSDAELLLRGACAPLGQGTDLASGFLRRLGEAPTTEALGMALRKQLAFLLLPFWGGFWSTLVFVIHRDPVQNRTIERIALIGTLLQIGLIGLWLIAIGRACFG